ncbi:MAG: ribonuclease HI [Kiritimatiellae bacterium]|nr:ribonuclease HI [Kiritimatiellia bacterium]
MDSEQHISIYTDGACSPNPGPGGYGVIIEHNGHVVELSGGFSNTTNNRMEILGAIRGMAALTEDQVARGVVAIYSDSRYVVDMFNGGYAEKWRANGWRLASRQPAQNTDLWAELLTLAEARRVSFHWVKGHNEHPQNERCDELAVLARQQDALPPDEGYAPAVVQSAPEQLSLFDSI